MNKNSFLANSDGKKSKISFDKIAPIENNTVTATVSIKGMTCGKCVAHVDSALKAEVGVVNSHVELSTNSAMVEYMPNLISLEKIKDAVEKAGYEMIINSDEEKESRETEISVGQKQSLADKDSLETGNVKKTSNNETVKSTFPVMGMTCASCVAHVDKAIKKQFGVKNVSINLATQSALIEYDPDSVSPESLKTAVSDAGYELIIEEQDTVELQKDT